MDQHNSATGGKEKERIKDGFLRHGAGASVAKTSFESCGKGTSRVLMHVIVTVKGAPNKQAKI